MALPQALLAAALITLAGCVSPLPEADPTQAWVELHSPTAASLLMADLLDGKRWPDGRYFQMPSGAHELRGRFMFEVRGGGGHDGFAEPRQITCLLLLRYAGFEAGQRYRWEARAWLMEAKSRLLNSAGDVLAQGETLRCGPY